MIEKKIPKTHPENPKLKKLEPSPPNLGASVGVDFKYPARLFVKILTWEVEASSVLQICEVSLSKCLYPQMDPEGFNERSKY